MKNSKEITEYVFAALDEYESKNKKRNAFIKKCSAVSLSFLIVVSIGYFAKNNLNGRDSFEYSQSEIVYSKEKNEFFRDAYSSGKVDISNAVRIMSYVSNPGKYALDESRKVDISNAVRIMSYVSNPDKYALDEAGITLADV